VAQTGTTLPFGENKYKKRNKIDRDRKNNRTFLSISLSILPANIFVSTVMQCTYTIYVLFLFVVRNDDGFKVGGMAHGVSSGLYPVDDGQH
jgi:hypothetical protein